MITATQTFALEVNNLEVVFPGDDGDLVALHNMCFSVRSQEFLCLLGPSGSGKSALLRVLSGLLSPTGGDIHFASNIYGKPPLLGMVFQDANLMPWRTVIQNIMLPLEMRGTDPIIARSKAKEWIHLIGLEEFENCWPRDLSGGMAQRVAMARALIQEPDLLLLDEPFGALDALTRERMGNELLRLWQVQKTTVIMVTHSISEALMLSDRVLVFTERPGRICLELTVDLPRPRFEEIRYTQRFNELEHTLRAAITG